MKKILALTLLALSATAASAITPLWLRDAKISPDGKFIAFCYKGDLWKVPANGGEAVRLTATDDYENTPIWSPDSKLLAFASNKYGNNDIFVMPIEGGIPARLTYNSVAEVPEAFSPDGKNVIFSAAIQAPAQSAMFPTSRMTQVYEVPVKGGAARQMLGTPAQMIHFMPDGKGAFLYQDVKGMENEWRKHHTSSVTRDIWLYDPSTGKHTNLTDRPGEDRNPVAAGADFYFLSERKDGSMNVYRAPMSNPADVKAITDFKKHPVRFLSISGDGTLCYTYDGEIYTQAPNGKPSKVKITLIDDYTNDPYKLSLGSLKEMTVSPDGKQVAFVARGNVFVTSVEYKTTKQITNTPEAESWVAWGNDSKSLYYTSERDGKYNIYKATMGRADDPNFANATIIDEEAVFKNDGHERTKPQLSPDGKKLAFILDRQKLAVKDMKSGKVTELTDGSTYHHRNGAFNYSWSPNSKWITLEVVNRDPYTDIAIINVDNGQLTNITESGYFDESPRFTADGKAIIWGSERYGMRNHASWGSMMDVMIAFLSQEAYDDYCLSKEDSELAAERRKAKEKEKDKDDDTDNNTKKTDKKDSSKDKIKKIAGLDADTLGVDLVDISDRIVRLSPFSSDLKDMVLTSDGKTLFFITSGDGSNNTLWEYTMRDGTVASSKSISSGLKGFETSADGKKIFIFGSSMQELNPSSKKLTPITYTGSQTVDPAAERQYMFDYVVREERERFYDKKMHGVDWTDLTDHYRKFLPHISNNYDFAEMMSEILGELNVSHTGCTALTSGNSLTERTASLGLLYDMTYTGDGLKVVEIVKKSPFDNAETKLAPGMIIEKINGENITPTTDFTESLKDLSGKNTLISIYDPDAKSHFDEVVKPITTSKMNDLMYQRWVKARADDVERWSNGRLGYVHIKSMNDPSFRTVYSDVLGKYKDKDGIVIDIRWNGGGRLHEDIEVLFSGDKYLTQVIRGIDACDMPSRRWNKPSVMLMSEACYSNAHGTPWVYKTKGLGKLVGMPVAGTMTSVNWVYMQDPSLYFGIPVVGYRTAEGNYLENTQLEPDVRIANDPAVIVTGEDQQLRKAVESLLQSL